MRQQKESLNESNTKSMNNKNGTKIDQVHQREENHQHPTGTSTSFSTLPQSEPENQFKILIATDNHIGYLEKDPIRGQDSFVAFEEILQVALEQEVDFLLLGGDLFHENNPSRSCLHETFALLRKYCLGDKYCPIALHSDPTLHFGPGSLGPNYMDPNINISLPVFSIHGNHDDPLGVKSLCSLDILSTAGYVNYFGKQTGVDSIDIKPILLSKGNQKLALYGLGNIRDERLHRAFKKNQVQFFQPAEDAEDWFKLFVIHQNRSKHGECNHIPEEFLEPSLDLVLWGHEHECMIHPMRNEQHGFHITQPGSSVATSLCEGEAAEKHVGLLHVKDNQFRLEKIKLKTVRPFVMDDIELASVDGLDPLEPTQVQRHLQGEIRRLIQNAKKEWLSAITERVEADFPKPLIRLKVDYSGGFTTFNPQRFGQAFADDVANPKELLLFYRKKTVGRSGKVMGMSNAVQVDLQNAFMDEEDFHVEDLVAEYLAAEKLDILPEKQLMDAVRGFVEKDDTAAIKDFMESSLRQTRDHLQKLTISDENMPELEKQIETEKQAQEASYIPGVNTTATKKSGSSAATRIKSSTAVPSHIDESKSSKSKPSSSGRNASATGAFCTSKTTQASKAPKAAVPLDDGDIIAIPETDDENDVDESAPKRRTASKATSKPALARSNVSRAKSSSRIISDDDVDMMEPSLLYSRQPPSSSLSSSSVSTASKPVAPKRAAPRAKAVVHAISDEDADDSEEEIDDVDDAFRPAPKSVSKSAPLANKRKPRAAPTPAPVIKRTSRRAALAPDESLTFSNFRR